MLTRLIYASRAAEGVGIAEVRAIIEVAGRNNTADGVTGILCFDRAYFLQYLEGQRDAINRIYNKITTDPRHHNVILLEYSEIERRLFGTWSMAYLSAQEDKIKSVIKDYSPNEVFNPYELRGKQASSLVLDLSNSLTREDSFNVLNR